MHIAPTAESSGHIAPVSLYKHTAGPGVGSATRSPPKLRRPTRPAQHMVVLLCCSNKSMPWLALYIGSWHCTLYMFRFCVTLWDHFVAHLFLSAAGTHSRNEPLNPPVKRDPCSHTTPPGAVDASPPRSESPAFSEIQRWKTHSPQPWSFAAWNAAVEARHAGAGFRTPRRVGVLRGDPRGVGVGSSEWIEVEGS